MSTRKRSFRNPTKAAEALGPVWFFGIHAVAEALRNPARRANRLIVTRNALRELGEGLAESLALEAEILEPKKITQILPEGAVHQGVGLLVEPLPEPILEDVCGTAETDRPVVVLDQVTDPHNVGAILRTAAAFGARALITTRRHSPEITGTLAKVASGAVEHVPYIQIGNLSEAITQLQNMGYQTVGLTEDGEQDLSALAPFGPVAIVLGAEGTGLRQKTRNTCDVLAKLPTHPPIASLNVSNAAAVSLYEIIRN
jgi:23S rRNA (guanosine2251-2'-O)-methyltransferase